MTILQPGQPGIVYTANGSGTIGGSVLIDPENFLEQAALFHDDQVKLIPPQPGEFTSFVRRLNDPGTALVTSDSDFGRTHLLYQNGQAMLLDFGPTVTNPRSLDINNQGIIAGRQGISSSGATGFRFDPRTGETMLLNTFPGDPTETQAWGVGINNRGEVLGYSFTIFPVVPYHERIGVWDRNGNFKTYFVENTVSNGLLFNDNNLIVITLISRGADRFNSFLVPKPGVRLNLADLVENLPSGADLFFVQDLNDHGNMVGSGALGSFLLERIDEDESCTTPAAATQALSGATGTRTASLAAAAMLRQHLPPPHALKDGSALSQDPVENAILRRWGHSLD